MIEKRVLMEIGDCRIREDDKWNDAVERWELYWSPIDKDYREGWRFKGFCPDVLGGLRLISRKHLLMDEVALFDGENLIKQVEESEERIMDAINELRGGNEDD